jgi:hypothetical protein
MFKPNISSLKRVQERCKILRMKSLLCLTWYGIILCYDRVGRPQSLTTLETGSSLHLRDKLFESDRAQNFKCISSLKVCAKQAGRSCVSEHRQEERRCPSVKPLRIHCKLIQCPTQVSLQNAVNSSTSSVRLIPIPQCLLRFNALSLNRVMRISSNEDFKSGNG